MTIEKYSWVNALRGYAILLVIFIHTSEFFFTTKLMRILTHTGDMGVQLFFIMSSFTLFNSYSRRINNDGKHTKRMFFIRRLFRIAPYYYVAGLIYVLYTLFIKKQKVYAIALISNYTFTNGLYLPAINYLPPGGWSVGVEMLFYLSIPLLYKYVNTLKKSVIYLIITITASNIINYSLYYFITNYTTKSWETLRNWQLYFWLPNQFPVFIFGIVLFYIYKNIKISKKTGSRILVISLISLLVLSLIHFSVDYPAYFFQREYVYGFVFMCLAIGLYTTKNTYLLNPLVQRIGIVSFSMYLNHFIIVWVLSQFGKNPLLNLLHYKYDIPNYIMKNDLLFLFWYFLVVATTVGISNLTYKYIEIPGINMGKYLIKRLKEREALH